jgi:hypothetical protein
LSDDTSNFEREIAWLKTASPDDWHRVALDYNWDEGVETLYWIVQQPDCDRATALDIFWKGQPAWYLHEAVEDGEDADNLIWTMLKYIAARINARGYTRSKIAFDATQGLRQDHDELAGYVKKLTDPPLKVHPDMLRSARGREIVNDTDFYRRYPFAHSVLIETPALDAATIEQVPDLVAARSAADSVVTNVFCIGFLAMSLVMYPKLFQNIAFLSVALVAFGICAYFAVTELRELNGLLRANRLHLMRSVLFGTLLLAVCAGAVLAGVAVMPVLQFRDWFVPAYGTMACIAVLLVPAALLYLLIGRGLARVVIGPHSLREV